MNNNDKTIVCIGRIKTIEKLEENKTKVTLHITSAFFDKADEYNNKLINCILTNKLSDAINQFCKKNDTIGINGTITKDKNINVYKLTCLTSEENIENIRN